ncbi:MAG: TonB-dependent receptor [Alphaproteobacteria bacterium]|nr:TonB-dependent receptor [Alphaproteobacteria bacterium]
MFSKKFLSGAALTALTMSMGGVAYAQSTASQTADEEIVVTGTRRSLDGLQVETAPRARTTITEEYIESQAPGQSILNTLNVVPGVNFTNNDAFGSSGGNLRLRGFDGSRVLLTFDGIPLNDTGNYAIFSNQQVDSELISRASVNLGTTDVDSPTAAVTGGTINYVTRLPSDEAALVLQPSLGTENYQRIFVMGDTGAFGPWGTSAWGSASWQEYDQFVGPGELQKYQVNARLYQPLQGSDFLSLSFHFNRNRNNFYRAGNDAAWAFYGGDNLQNLDTCTRDAPTAGVADNDGSSAAGAGAFQAAADNPANPLSCDNFAGLRINPSNTGNIRGQSRFSFGDNLTFTFDPTVQYVLANGGGSTRVAETDSRLRSGVTGVANSRSINPACSVFTGTNAGVDLNGDCDTLDTVRLYSPSNTNTLRYTLSTSLIWDINDTNRVIFGYTYDTGRHRQTGEYGLLDGNGDPLSVWGGKDGEGEGDILTLAGQVFQKRNRLSIATLSQPSIRYIGDFFNDRLTLDVGIRAPEFTRDLDQRCWAPISSTSDPTCNFDPGLANDVNPFRVTVDYSDVLPNVGLTYRPAEGHQFYVAYAETLSAPRTDDLYSGVQPANIQGSVEPETSRNYDIGYRFNSDRVLFSVGAFYNEFDNFIVRSFDPNTGETYSRNVGAVNRWGGEAQLGVEFTEHFSLISTAAFNDSEVQENLPGTTLGSFFATAGKQVVETPEWTFTNRFEYDGGDFQLGLQQRFVGDRWRTDINDLKAPEYTVFDFDANWDILENTSLRFNVVNLFDQDYIGSMSTANTGTPTYNIGAPRTMWLTVRTQF